MTLRHLHIFVSVYEHKSITKAANTLHIAQPSVSLAIKELGEYYGVQLFDRIGRGITPLKLLNIFMVMPFISSHYLTKWSNI